MCCGTHATNGQRSVSDGVLWYCAEASVLRKDLLLVCAVVPMHPLGSAVDRKVCHGSVLMPVSCANLGCLSAEVRCHGMQPLGSAVRRTVCYGSVLRAVTCAKLQAALLLWTVRPMQTMGSTVRQTVCDGSVLRPVSCT